MLNSSAKTLQVKKETFSSSIDLAVINDNDKRTVVEIITVLLDFQRVACRRVL